jgi:hypothetical protein
MIAIGDVDAIDVADEGGREEAHKDQHVTLAETAHLESPWIPHGPCTRRRA